MFPNILYREPGQRAQFYCASSEPPTWKFKGNILSINGLPYRKKTLYLYNVTQKNDGFYICTGKTAPGYFFQAFARLIILSKLKSTVCNKFKYPPVVVTPIHWVLLARTYCNIFV